jgi:hypothetical protein
MAFSPGGVFREALVTAQVAVIDLGHRLDPAERQQQAEVALQQQMADLSRLQFRIPQGRFGRVEGLFREPSSKSSTTSLCPRVHRDGCCTR